MSSTMYAESGILHGLRMYAQPEIQKAAEEMTYAADGLTGRMAYLTNLYTVVVSPNSVTRS